MQKPIPGYEGLYSITTDGRVYSHVSGKELAPYANQDGYVRVSLRRAREQTSEFVHKLVLLAFVGPRPRGHVCRHLNGDRTDNRLENLAWGTQEENMRDRTRHGTTPRMFGETNGRAKLTHEDVLRIRELYELGDYTKSELARAYGVCLKRITDIVNGQAWSHV